MYLVLELTMTNMQLMLQNKESEVLRLLTTKEEVLHQGQAILLDLLIQKMKD